MKTYDSDDFDWFFGKGYLSQEGKDAFIAILDKLQKQKAKEFRESRKLRK